MRLRVATNVLNHWQEPRSTEPEAKLKFKESNELGQPENGAGSCRVHLLVLPFLALIILDENQWRYAKLDA